VRGFFESRMCGQSEKWGATHGSGALNLAIDITSHNVYFATHIYDVQMTNDTPAAGKLFCLWLYNCRLCAALHCDCTTAYTHARYYTVPRGCADIALASRCDLQHNLTFPQLCREMYAFLQSVACLFSPAFPPFFLKNLTFALLDIYI
jgi:hypothetical protein